MQEQLSLVAAATSTSNRSRSRIQAPERATISVVAGEGVMKTPELKCMTPLLRFLQLLCENHNTNLQVSTQLAISVCSIIYPVLFFPQNYLRRQTHSKQNYNLILETLRLLDCICGVTTGGLVLLSLYIHANNVTLINQCLESLTEYCQGPCHENQVSFSKCMT